jgi:hypothetical protein
MTAILKLLKSLIMVCLVGTILGFILLIVFNLWILPLLFQKYIQEDLSRKYTLNLSCSKISYDPVYGIILKGLSLQRELSTEALRIEIESAQIDIAFLSLIQRSFIIKSFKLDKSRIFFTDEKKKPILFSLKKAYGSLHQEQVRTKGLKGWLGGFDLEDLSFLQNSLSIERAQCVISEKRMTVQGAKIFWHTHPIGFEGVFDLLEKKVDGVFKFYDANLFAHFEFGKLYIGLFSNQTKLFSVMDLSHKFQKPVTRFYGFLNFEDFLPLMRRLEKKVSFALPLKLSGWLVGFDFGEFFLSLDSFSVGPLFLEKALLKAGFYQNQFLAKFFEAKSCKGFLNANGWVHLISGAYTGSFNFGQLNLNCLSPVLFPKGIKHKGIVSGDLTFLGLGNFGENKVIDPVKNIDAEGHLEVRKGDLGKIRIMKGVLKVFKPISNLSKIRLKSGTAHYYVRYGDLLVQELKMMSPTLMMECNGKMGLEEKNLDLDLHASVRPFGLKDKTFLARLLSGGLTMAGDQIWKAKISGTFKKPVITPTVLPVLQPVKDVLRIPFRPFQKKENNGRHKSGDRS